MKKLQTSVALAFVVALMGCATTWQSSAGKVLSSTALTVDAAMKSWAIYVVKFHPPANQEQKVKEAYEKYQVAMKAACEAYSTAIIAKDQSVWMVASSVLTAASGSLTQLITAFQGGGAK